MKARQKQKSYKPVPLWFDLAIIGGLALAVRLIYVYQLSSTVFFRHPVVDGQFFDTWARQVQASGWGHEGVYFRAPLYAYFLAFIYGLSQDSYMAARIVQSFLGAGTAVLTFLLAYKLTGRRAVARLAGAVAALYGILVFHDGELLAETLLTPLILASALVHAWNSRRKDWRLSLLSGLLIGLAAITRPTALILMPVFLLDLLWLSRDRTGKPKAKPPWKLAGAVAAGWMLAVAPVTLHNLRQGDMVLIATHGGLNFYAGNNILADGSHGVIPGIGLDWDEAKLTGMASRAVGHWLKPSEVSDYYYRLGRQYIVEHPGAWLKLTIKKIFAFWTRLEISENRDLYVFENETALMPYLRLIGFWIIGPLGLLGLWLGWRRKWLPDWFLWFIAVFMAGYVAYLVVSRYRLPLLPFIIIAAATAVVALYEDRTRLFQKQGMIWLGILGAAFIFVNVNVWGIYASNPAHAYYSLGTVYLRMNDDTQARVWLEKTLQTDPAYRDANLNLGIVAHRQGDLTGAENAFMRELELDPREVRAINNLGSVRLDQGRYAEAETLFKRVLDLDLDSSNVRLTQAQILFAKGMERAVAGDLAAGADYFKQALDLDPSKATYYYNYALAIGRLGQTQVAVAALQQALRLRPDYTAARTLLDRVQSQAP